MSVSEMARGKAKVLSDVKLWACAISYDHFTISFPQTALPLSSGTSSSAGQGWRRLWERVWGLKKKNSTHMFRLLTGEWFSLVLRSCGIFFLFSEVSELATPENTITYHNALCLSPQNGPKRNWKQCLCKILGWETKSIMVCYGIFGSGQLRMWRKKIALLSCVYKRN